MKILVLVGSYRKHGNTAQIVGLIEGGLREVVARDARLVPHNEPLEIERVYLGHQNIGACRGCRVCFDRGEEACPLKDDLLAIKAKMDEADGIIVASPVYVNDVSGSVKNWIDRLAFVCHRPEFAGKCAYLVATVGGSPTSHALSTLNTALRTWGFYIVGQKGFKMGALMAEDQAQARFQRETDKIAQEFVRAIYERGFSKPSFLALMTFKIQQWSWQHVRAVQDSVDYVYWKNRGWIEPHCDFFIQHQANPVKVGLARLAGTLIARLVT